MHDGKRVLTRRSSPRVRSGLEETVERRGGLAADHTLCRTLQRGKRDFTHVLFLQRCIKKLICGELGPPAEARDAI